MSAVMNENTNKGMSLELGPTKEYRRRLLIDRSYGRYWVGVFPPKAACYSVGFSGCDVNELSVDRSNDALHTKLYLVVSGAHFPITENEAKRICATFGLEVRES